MRPGLYSVYVLVYEMGVYSETTVHKYLNLSCISAYLVEQTTLSNNLRQMTFKLIMSTNPLNVSMMIDCIAKH